MNLRRGGIWYLAGLLLAIIAGVIAIFALRQAVPATPESAAPATRPVIVAGVNIEARQIVPFESIEARDYLLEDIPSGAVFLMEDAVGKFALQPVAAGQPLLAQNLANPPSGAGGSITSTIKLSLLLPESKIAVSIPADDLLSKSGAVQIGDRIDLLSSLIVVGDEEGEAGQVTMMHIQNVPVVQLLTEVASNATSEQAATQTVIGMIIAVDPQDVVILRYFLDSNARVSISLRPTELTSVFNVVPVTANFLADKYGIRVPRPIE